MSPGQGQDDDLTRKQRREQARAQRKAIEEAQRASATRRRRLIQLGGLIAVVVVIIVVVVVATGSGGQTKAHLTKKEANSTVATVSSLLTGIPQSGNVLGDPKAPVTLEYFGDLECPICDDFTLDVLPTIVSEFVRTDKLKIEYHSFSTATGTAESEGAEPQGTFESQQVAALAAGKQNKMWDFLELFYHEQGKEDTGYVTESYIQGLAEQVPGLNLVQWTADRNDVTLKAQIAKDAQAAAEHGFEGTPSFLLGKSGTKLAVFDPGDDFTEPGLYKEAIEKALSS